MLIENYMLGEIMTFNIQLQANEQLQGTMATILLQFVQTIDPGVNPKWPKFLIL